MPISEFSTESAGGQRAAARPHNRTIVSRCRIIDLIPACDVDCLLRRGQAVRSNNPNQIDTIVVWLGNGDRGGGT